MSLFFGLQTLSSKKVPVDGFFCAVVYKDKIDTLNSCPLIEGRHLDCWTHEDFLLRSGVKRAAKQAGGGTQRRHSGDPLNTLAKARRKQNTTGTHAFVRVSMCSNRNPPSLSCARATKKNLLTGCSALLNWK